MNLALKNISLLDAHQFTEEAALIVTNGVIDYAGSYKNLPPTLMAAAEKIGWQDGLGNWVTPGFINGHTHVAMSFLREIAHDADDMIPKVFFPAESNLTSEQTYQFSLPSIAASLKSGVTSFVDHYYHSESVRKALSKFGVRGFTAETLADLGGAKPQRHNTEHLENLISTKNELQQSLLGPHAMDTLSVDYLKDIAEVSKKTSTPLHFHLSQTQREREHCLKLHNLSPVALADKLGLLSHLSLGVHLVSADETDVLTLKNKKCFIGFCPSSQILYEKLSPIELFTKHQVPIVLGTDCAASHDSMDIMSELRFYYLLARDRGCKISAQEILKSAWDNPANWLQKKLGRLEKGYLADFVIYKRELQHHPCLKPHTHFLMSLSSRDVKDVYVQGNLTLSNGRSNLVDENLLSQELKPYLDEFKTKYLSHLLPQLN